jgi:UPF0716 family protein affecting phage T7 exclusion
MNVDARYRVLGLSLSDDFALITIFSLVGVNLTLWLLMGGFFAGTELVEAGGFLPGM